MILRSDETVELPTSNGPMRTCVFLPVAAGHYPGLALRCYGMAVDLVKRKLGPGDLTDAEASGMPGH